MPTRVYMTNSRSTYTFGSLLPGDFFIRPNDDDSMVSYLRTPTGAVRISDGMDVMFPVAEAVFLATRVDIQY